MLHINVRGSVPLLNQRKSKLLKRAWLFTQNLWWLVRWEPGYLIKAPILTSFLEAYANNGGYNKLFFPQPTTNVSLHPLSPFILPESWKQQSICKSKTPGHFIALPQTQQMNPFKKNKQLNCWGCRCGIITERGAVTSVLPSVLFPLLCLFQGFLVFIWVLMFVVVSNNCAHSILFRGCNFTPVPRVKTSFSGT